MSGEILLSDWQVNCFPKQQIEQLSEMKGVNRCKSHAPWESVSEPTTLMGQMSLGLRKKVL
tara:strand:- start:289 stop:471 length:183 start_codon:yes stop_codon:yes gene_type:complete